MLLSETPAETATAVANMMSKINARLKVTASRMQGDREKKMWWYIGIASVAVACGGLYYFGHRKR